MPLPFQSLLPYDGRVLLLHYVPLLPVCVENLATSDTSESVSAGVSGSGGVDETDDDWVEPVDPVEPYAAAVGAKFSGSADNAMTVGRNRFEDWLGREADYGLIFTSQAHWTDGTGAFIAASYWMTRAGATTRPVIWSIPLCPTESPTTNWLTEVIAGTHDAEFATAAASLAAFRPADETIPLRIGWECNGDWFAWSPDFATNSVTAADYVAAFQRVVGIFRAASARFQVVWNVNLKSSTQAATEAMYPGDAYVDVISGDTYFNPTYDGTNPTAAFNTLRNHATGLTWLATFATAHGKPYAIDEYAAQDNYGTWVDLMAEWIADQGEDLLWHIWWDSNSEFAGAISDGLSGTTGERYLANFGA